MKRTILVTSCISIIWLALITIWLVTPGGNSERGETANTTPVLDRVLESGTIRASYAVFEPLCMKDPNSGELSGIGVDLLEEVGKRLELRVEWVEETGWGVLFEGLNTARFDTFGPGVWRNGSRGRVGVFSQPLFFNVIKVWGRGGEKRFTSLGQINSSEVRVATQDGGMDDLIAKSDFPEARLVSMPEISSYTDVLLNVTTKKADVTFAEPGAIKAFLERNPGALEELFPNDPLRVFPICYPFASGAFGIQSMVDSALVELHNDGTVERILQRYEKTANEFYRVQRPYQQNE